MKRPKLFAFSFPDACPALDFSTLYSIHPSTGVYNLFLHLTASPVSVDVCAWNEQSWISSDFIWCHQNPLCLLHPWPLSCPRETCRIHRCWPHIVVFSRWDLALNVINTHNTNYIDKLPCSIQVVSQRGTAFGKSPRCPSQPSSERVSAKGGIVRFEAENSVGTEDPFSIDCFQAQSC